MQVTIVKPSGFADAGPTPRLTGAAAAAAAAAAAVGGGAPEDSKTVALTKRGMEFIFSITNALVYTVPTERIFVR